MSIFQGLILPPRHPHLPHGYEAREVGSDFDQRPSGLLTPKSYAVYLEQRDTLLAIEMQMRELQRMMATFGRGFGYQYQPSVPEPPTDMSRSEPFVGWKTLRVKAVTTQNYQLVGQWGSPYGIDAHAFCGSGHAHDVPAWQCGCGFYALKDTPAEPEYGRFLAEVELFGRVIEGEHGWRAARQRVLSLKAFRTCGKCDKDAVGFKVSRNTNVMPVCRSHSPRRQSRRIDLAQITAAVGTEVRWVS